MNVGRARITALGRYVPPRVLTNAELARIVDTSDEWIVQRTGIRERHVVDPGIATSDLAACAVRNLLTLRGIGADTIELVIVATTTPDMIFPSTACLVQHKLGMPHVWGFDLGAACSGFTYALTVGAQFIASGAHQRVVVIGADVMSSIIDYRDRTTCVLFGDGAGAVLLEASGEPHVGLLGFAHEVDGSGGEALCMPAGGSRRPASAETVMAKLHYVHQDGPTVFKFAVRRTEEICRQVLEQQGLTAADVDLFVSHQANKRIITAAADRLGLDPSKVIINVDRYGNTTAATIPLALGDALDQGRLRAGDLVLITSVGAGFTIGAALVRWAY